MMTPMRITLGRSVACFTKKSSTIESRIGLLNVCGLQSQSSSNFSRVDSREHIKTSCCINIQKETFVEKPLLKPQSFCYIGIRNAGHSKWQNIKHTKAAKDAQKAQTTTKLMFELRKAVKENNNITDPSLNSKLARVMEMGKNLNISNQVMKDNLKKLEKNQDKLQTVYMEGKGPGNVVIIFQISTESPKRVKADLGGLYKKCGGSLGVPSPVLKSHAFEFKGIIRASKEQIQDLEKAMEIAIECEAEEVTEVENDEGNMEYEFICDGEDFPRVTGNIKKLIDIEDAYEIYIPRDMNKITPSEVETQLMEKLRSKIGEVPDVVDLFDNIQTQQ